MNVNKKTFQMKEILRSLNTYYSISLDSLNHNKSKKFEFCEESFSDHGNYILDAMVNINEINIQNNTKRSDALFEFIARNVCIHLYFIFILYLI